jgi:MFS family permease
MNTPADAPRSYAFAWFVVVVLALANCFSFIDRLVLSLLVQPLKVELHLSDTAVSLLQGAAFSIFYCTVGILLARLADRTSRKWIATIGVALWCVMTAITGTARSFWQLFLYRIGVGVGEASLSPTAYSLIAGYFPPSRLALAIGVFSSGVTVGMGLAYLLGGATIKWVAAQGGVTLPLLGALAGWRLVFVIIGSLGLPIVILMLFVREPRRPAAATPVTFGDSIAQYRSRWREYSYLLVGYGMTSITSFAMINWTPTFYQRHYGATIPAAATLLGSIAVSFGLLGALVGGSVADALERRGDPLAKLRVMAWCGTGLLLPGIVAPFMPTMGSSVAVIAATFFFGSAATGPASAYIQTITPERMRSQFGALYQFSLTFVGATLGPTAVALFTDFFFRDESQIGYSLSSVSALSNPIACYLLWRGYRYSRGLLAARGAAPAVEAHA